MKNYDYYFRRSTSCGQLLALRVGPAAPHPARPSLRLSSHILVWSSLHCVAQTSTNVVVRGSVKHTCEESNLQRNLQERLSSVYFLEQDYICGPRNVFKKKIVPSVLLPKKDGNGLTLSYNLKN